MPFMLHIPIIVHGASGRMGRELLQLISASERFALAATLPGRWPVRLELGTVVIDFSLPSALPDLIDRCLAQRLPLVSGTTGLTPSQLEALQLAAAQIPILWAPNFSLGVAVLRRALKLAAATLPGSWDVSLLDTHHRHKLDSPSGTARWLAQSIDEARGDKSDARAVQVCSARIGEVVGDHQICFAGPSERLELTHRADRRSLFAEGALHTAAWLRDQPPGWYSLDDSLDQGTIAPR